MSGQSNSTPATVPPEQALNNLRHLDVASTVDAYVHSISGNPAINVKMVSNIKNMLKAMKVDELKSLIQKLMNTLTDTAFQKKMLLALGEHIKNHPYHTAFLVVGIVLLCNPLAMAGFGALGPVAGSLAAAWQASIGGSVAAGSAFATLQGIGMVYATVIPVAGAAIVATSLGTAALGHENIKKGISNLHENVVPAVGAAAVAAATGTGHVMCKVVKDIKTIVTEAAGTEVQNWSRGDYGDPVKRWWSGEYGTPVAQWWNGDFGNPVRDWATAVTEKGKKN